MPFRQLKTLRFFKLLALISILVIGMLRPAQASNFTLEFDDNAVVLNYTGSAQTVTLPLVLRYYGGFQSPPVNLDFSLSRSGATLMSAEPLPLLIGGEIGI